jgi:hypothetical protein
MKSRPVVNFFQVASLLMLLVAVALLAAITTMHFAIHGAEVQVPLLKGMTVAEARSQAAGTGTEPGRGQSLLLGRRGRGTHSVAVAGAGNGGAAGVEGARGREPGAAKGGSARTRWAKRSGWRRSNCGAWAGGRRYRAVALRMQRRERCWRRTRLRTRRASRSPASTCWWPRRTTKRRTDSSCLT